MSYKKYFESESELLKKLESLHEKKYNLKRSLTDEKHLPFIVDVAGLPRTGKSVSIDRVQEFFKKAGIKVEKGEEPAFLIKQSLNIDEIRRISPLEFNDKTLSVSKINLENLKRKNPDIIIMDRGVIDNYFWYQMLYEDGSIDLHTYEKKLLGLVSDIMAIDEIFVLTAKPEIIVLRDYINQIYLEKRNKTTIERVEFFQKALSKLIPKLQKISGSKEKIICYDTSNVNELETAIFIADNIMEGIQKRLKSCKRV